MMWRKQAAPGKTALILSGGGARAAYQVGVIKALAELLPKNAANPFPILCGTSAGAINATALAVYSDNFREAAWRLGHVWRNFHVDQVFRADSFGLIASGLHWLAALSLGGLGKYNPSALLDRDPLYELLEKYLDLTRIQEAIEHGNLHALSITASSYTTGHSVAFFQGREEIEPWQRSRRWGVPCNIEFDHLMASSAIPFVFGAIRLGNEYFGDGSMRQTAPISPALHLGADRLFVIGVKSEESVAVPDSEPTYPSMAQIAGHVLNSIFLDNVETDLERLRRINRTLSQIPPRHRPENSVTLRKAEVFSISPSRNLDAIAVRYSTLLPRPLRFLLRGMGVSHRSGANLLSYLLFEREYCRELMALGYGDTLQRKHEILEFLGEGVAGEAGNG